jgi:hypothetical protein
VVKVIAVVSRVAWGVFYLALFGVVAVLVTPASSGEKGEGLVFCVLVGVVAVIVVGGVELIEQRIEGGVSEG